MTCLAIKVFLGYNSPFTVVCSATWPLGGSETGGDSSLVFIQRPGNHERNRKMGYSFTLQIRIKIFVRLLLHSPVA